MIYCLNCGKGIPDQSKFCTFCGTPTAQIDPQNPVVPEQTTVNVPPVTPDVTPPPPQNVTPPPPQYANPNPPQYVNPNPPQYVNPNPPQYVNPTPQQFVNPQQFAGQQHAARPVVAKNEFYKNIGFWGAVLLLVGFFLPYNNINEGSLYYVVTEGGGVIASLYLYLIFPISGAILILQGLTGAFPKVIVAIFKILPLLMLIFIGIGISQAESNFASTFGDDIETILKNIGVGFYMIVIGSLLVLFFKTTKTKI
jgi:hypothetical protein